MSDRKVVMRIEEGMDREEVYATTYQLRNPFHQFSDAFASELDTFNYFNLAFSADMVPRGGTVLDVCSGRGLLIPFLHYRQRQCDTYVGVDIHPPNAIWKDGRDPRRRGVKCPSCSFDIGNSEMGEWGINLVFVASAAEEMIEAMAVVDGVPAAFDHISYTSSIEHMQPEAQARSLIATGKLANPDTTLYLTCPVTEEGRSGYDAQYAAHVYEPTEKELREWLAASGWEIDEIRGLLTKVSIVKERLSGAKLERAKDLLRLNPRQFALPMIAALFPETATEKGYICRRKGKVTPKPQGVTGEPLV